MPLRAFAVIAVLLVATPTLSMTGSVSAAAHAAPATLQATVVGAAIPDDTIPVDTINEYFPEDQAISDCVSSLPRPNCGSRAQGGWRQTLVFALLLLGLVFIAWRIVASSRAARSGAARPERDRRDA